MLRRFVGGLINNTKSVAREILPGRLCLLDHRVSPGAQTTGDGVFARPLTASFGAETIVCLAGQLR